MPQPHKPLRQQAAEKARGNQPCNPSQLGDPIDLEVEHPGPDTDSPAIENNRIVTSTGPSDDWKHYTPKERLLNLAKSAISGEPQAKGTEKVEVVGIGEGAGAVGGVVEREKKGSKL